MDRTLTIKEKLIKLLIEWHNLKLPSFIPRHLIQNPDKKKIISITGVRGAGKTYACFEMIDDLMKSGVPRENIIYIDFEDERLGPLCGNVLADLLAVHTEIVLRDSSKPRYCFLDEISRVPDWSALVETAVERNPDLFVVVTGSSLQIPEPVIAEKIERITVYPYAFQEYLNARGFEMEFSWNLLFSEQRSVIKRYFNEYIEKGGFPEVSNSSNHQRTLQENYRRIFDRDMVAPNTIENIRQFENFLKIQMDYVAGFSSVSTIEKEMKLLGHGLSKNTLMSYLGYALNASLLFEVKKFSSASAPSQRHPRKLYAVDHGLLRSIRFSSQDDNDRMLENVVFMELRRRYNAISYYSGKYCCDFVAMENGEVSACLQVCASFENSNSAERKIRDLCAVLDVFNLESGTVLTVDEHANLERDGKTIHIRPAWFFAIEQSGT